MPISTRTPGQNRGHIKAVGKESSQQLRLIVFQATMPDAILQLEQRLEPFVERFDGLAAATIERFAAAAAIELSAGQAAAVGLVARLDRLAARLILRAAFVLRADEATTGAFPFAEYSIRSAR